MAYNEEDKVVTVQGGKVRIGDTDVASLDKVPFAAMNKELVSGQTAEAKQAYEYAVSAGHTAADCIVCRQCENACPQHLPITDNLKKAAEMFE